MTYFYHPDNAQAEKIFSNDTKEKTKLPELHSGAPPRDEGKINPST